MTHFALSPRAWIAATTGLALLLATPTAAAAAGPNVRIDNFTFIPAAITIAAGKTLTWTNDDDIPHRVVSDNGLFKSPALDTKDHFSFTFAKPGTFSYFCSLHPRMTGRIIVTAN